MAHPKHAAASHEILDIIKERWSPRLFDSSRPVPTAELKRLFEAARWAPSSFNDQPWRFVVADRDRNADAFAGLLETLDPSNRRWAQHAPVLALVAVSLFLKRDGSVNHNAWYDTGQAIGFLTLQATSLGLAIRQMEGFDHAHAVRVCAIPEAHEPVVVMAIGYAREPDADSPERDRVAHLQPRQRTPIGDFVFEEVWGKGLK